MNIEILKDFSERELFLMLKDMKNCGEPKENIQAVVKEIAKRKPQLRKINSPFTATYNTPFFKD